MRTRSQGPPDPSSGAVDQRGRSRHRGGTLGSQAGATSGLPRSPSPVAGGPNRSRSCPPARRHLSPFHVAPPPSPVSPVDPSEPGEPVSPVGLPAGVTVRDIFAAGGPFWTTTFTSLFSSSSTFSSDGGSQYQIWCIPGKVVGRCGFSYQAVQSHL